MDIRQAADQLLLAEREKRAIAPFTSSIEKLLRIESQNIKA